VSPIAQAVLGSLHTLRSAARTMLVTAQPAA
jgi:hypothetical protein